MHFIVFIIEIQSQLQSEYSVDVVMSGARFIRTNKCYMILIKTLKWRLIGDKQIAPAPDI
ncbi:hypothetical protein BDV97DRAFT_363964 [Delphinella strobiligena]|nr:hypothetical protein BDV97DRAFT_363964 [Delphinella strobiligena]